MPCRKSRRVRALANFLSVIHNVSVPFGEADPKQPNVSATIWRTASDHTNRVYDFESTMSPILVWVKLDSLDLKKGAAVTRLKLGENDQHSGEVSAKFEEAKPLAFTGPKE